MGESFEDSLRLADGLLEAAQGKEPEVTSRLIDIASQLSGSMKGLEYRLKERDSILSKIERKSGRRRTLEQAAARMKDVLRYTYVSDSEQHAQEVRRFLEELDEGGYVWEESDIRNSWFEGNDYYGINMAVVTSDGYVFELQFHTEDSWNAKMKNHPLYEEQRASDTTDKRAAELAEEMAANLQGVAFPPGIDKIGTVIRRR